MTPDHLALTQDRLTERWEELAELVRSRWTREDLLPAVCAADWPAAGATLFAGWFDVEPDRDPLWVNTHTRMLVWALEALVFPELVYDVQIVNGKMALIRAYPDGGAA